MYARIKRWLFVAALVAACHKPSAKSPPDGGTPSCVVDTSKLDGCVLAP
jgi:hypothetical protein